MSYNFGLSVIVLRYVLFCIKLCSPLTLMGVEVQLFLLASFCWLDIISPVPLLSPL